MSDLILATFNARYAHSAFGLRYLLANLKELRERTDLLEFTLQERPLEAAEKILARQPRILGLSVYIWNAGLTLELVAILKRLAPELIIVLGGPEVSHECEDQELVALADYTICGEGDLAFAELCRELLAGQRPEQKLLRPPLPDLNRLALPYAEYTDEDLRQRVVYVEASRGCPYRCEFCLSSLDRGVRYPPLEQFLASMQTLFDRGARHFKFIDRTFNLRLEVSRAILEFFLDRYEEGLFLHFEMVPDRFPEQLRELVARFPPGALQFEIGIQTFASEVAERISRRQDYARLEDNLRFLRAETGVHIHADLIVGLPGESVESFGRGFDRLWALRPQEIQVGILKRLRGTPIIRHDQEWQMVYSPLPPYEILRNRSLTFEELQEMRRFARYWDLVGNRGLYGQTLVRLLSDTPFQSFRDFSRWLYAQTGATAALAQNRLCRLLFDYLVVRGEAESEVAADLIADYQTQGYRHIPEFIQQRPELLPAGERSARLPTRQQRHLRRG